jgi:hypothetical protein
VPLPQISYPLDQRSASSLVILLITEGIGA